MQGPLRASFGEGVRAWDFGSRVWLAKLGPGYVSCSLNSLKGDYIGDYIKGDTRSLDYSSCQVLTSSS